MLKERVGNSNSQRRSSQMACTHRRSKLERLVSSARSTAAWFVIVLVVTGAVAEFEDVLVEDVLTSITENTLSSCASGDLSAGCSGGVAVEKVRIPDKLKRLVSPAAPWSASAWSKYRPLMFEHFVDLVTRENPYVTHIKNDEKNLWMLELGAGHCAFSIAAANRGWTVLAMDARETRVPKAITDGEVPNIRFVVADVMDFHIPQRLDVVTILGLLEHLTADNVVGLMRRVCTARPRFVIVDTHFARVAKARHDKWDGVHFQGDSNRPTSALKQGAAFWFTESSLERLFKEAGFKRILRSDHAVVTDADEFYFHGRTARNWWLLTSE